MQLLYLNVLCYCLDYKNKFDYYLIVLTVISPHTHPLFIYIYYYFGGGGVGGVGGVGGEAGPERGEGGGIYV